MQERRPALGWLRQAVRFDGLWWRKFAYLGCVYGPEWWKRYSPPAIAALIYVLVGRNRQGAVQNMQRVLNEPDSRRAALAALRMFADFARCFTDTMEYYGPRPKPFRLDAADDDPLADALRRGAGAVVVTGHFGNWDVAARTMRKYESPVNVVMAREANASTQEYVRVARERAGVRVIYSDSSVFSSLNMIHALRQNEVVAMQLDRMVGPGGARRLPFFGALAPFASGPFVLARLSGAPLIPVFVPRLGTRHYAVRVGAEVHLKRDGRDAQALERAMGEVVGAFEAAVREFPSQWFQFAPFWPAAAAVVAHGGAARAQPRREAGG
jgi:phosphatidylinositol dimannoside acyltransferase